MAWNPRTVFSTPCPGIRLFHFQLIKYSAFYKLGYISSHSKGSIIEPLEADTMGAQSPLGLRSVSARSRLDHGSVSARSAFSVRSMRAR